MHVIASEILHPSSPQKSHSVLQDQQQQQQPLAANQSITQVEE